MKIDIQRAYDIRNKEKINDYRVLVDRLWPRGVKKEDLKIDLWAKDITPTDKLRKKFHSDEISGKEFEKEYSQEIENNKKWKDFKQNIIDKSEEKEIKLITAAKLRDYSHTYIIKKKLQEK